MADSSKHAVRACKTFKIEFELTVTMDEVGQEHLSGDQAAQDLPHLKRLQQALLDDEPALRKLMLAQIYSKLQDYIDYLAAQDEMGALERTAETLEMEDWKYFHKYNGDFYELTRPLRRSSLCVKMNKSIINELSGQAEEKEWQPVWSDLMEASTLGRLLDSMCLQPASIRFKPASEKVHYLVARHLSRQSDGVHIEARCTCDEALEGVGVVEEEAYEAVWEAYRKHSLRLRTTAENDEG